MRRQEIDKCQLTSHYIEQYGRSGCKRDKAIKLVSRLILLGYLKKIHKGPGPFETWIRYSLDDEFHLPSKASPWPPEVTRPNAERSKKRLTHVVDTTIVIDGEFIEVSPKKQALADKMEGMRNARAPRKSARVAPTPSQIAEDQGYKDLRAGYKAMLKAMDKVGNFGTPKAAIREFGKLLPELEENPTLLVDIVGSLKRYPAIAGNCPLGLGNFLAGRVWEDCLESEDSKVDWGEEEDF